MLDDPKRPARGGRTGVTDGGGGRAKATAADKPAPKRPDDRNYWMLKDQRLTREFKNFVKKAADARQMGTYHYVIVTIERQARIDLGLDPNPDIGQPTIADVVKKLDDLGRRVEALADALERGSRVSAGTPSAARAPSEEEIMARVVSKLLKMAKDC